MNASMITLVQCRHLVALAEEGHFGRAAKRVFLSQPALSRSIQAIEDKTGFAVFERHRGHVRPTQAGALVVEKAARVLMESRSLERELSLIRGGKSGDVAIGLGPFPAATLLRDGLARLRSEMQEIRIRVEINNWQRLLDMLLKEEIDFFISAVSEDMSGHPDIQINPLARHRVALYVRSDHPLAGRQTNLSEVWEYGVGAPKLTPNVARFLEGFLRLPAGTPLELSVQCDDIETLHSLALNTDTVILTTELAVRRLRHTSSLRDLFIDGLPTTLSSTALVTLKSRQLSPSTNRAIEIFREISDG